MGFDIVMEGIEHIVLSYNQSDPSFTENLDLIQRFPVYRNWLLIRYRFEKLAEN